MVGACFSAFFGLVIIGFNAHPHSGDPSSRGIVAGVVYLLASIAVFGLAAVALTRRRFALLGPAGALALTLLAIYESVQD